MTTMVEQDDTYTRTDLSDLVRNRRAELRMSLRAVEEHPGNVGPDGKPVIKRGWLDRLEKRKPVIPPQVPELTALSAVLDLPLGRLQDAAGAQFLGITSVWSESGEARALIAHAERLTPEQRDQLARLLAAFESAPRGEQ
ncbi:XRE family transcriptional regulator [Streptomyces albofaciens JCM 4342]|uniref:XRE family transcriptional regulator n=1 Tax=Streptomyces albofaciens TaxID=66866 RepID=UPI00123872E6|nr:XRE family transcriptional regulator [Streptomyces albofaciens]KAA6221765.1 XRE family transcriptional regulator [Streptomyces albofaciens JCM 4342]